jgi:putative nucleotidyltransferase with HDIG domain
VPRAALDLGRRLADRLGGGFVVLDAARGVCRVAGPVQVDLADFRAPDLPGDLRARDFTVNAMAASLGALIAEGRAVVEDPTGGLADLAARVIRLCAPGALREDPARALRAVRFGLRPGWRLHEGVTAAARDVAAAVPSVAAERIRDEIVLILREPVAGRGLRLLDDLGILGALLPESRAMRETPQPLPHRFDVWEHSLRAVEGTDALVARPDDLAPWGDTLRAHLAEVLGDGLTRAEALKLAALLHDVAKPETRAVIEGRVRFLGHDVMGAERAVAIAARFRLSGRATAVVERLVRQHLRPMHLAQAGGITARARHRFFRDLGDDARDLLLLTLADASAVRGDEPRAVWGGGRGTVVGDLMAGAAEEERLATTPPLLRGGDVMAAFDLPPGPEVGRLLARAREAQALGLVATPAEALDWLRQAPDPLLDTPPGGP